MENKQNEPKKKESVEAVTRSTIEKGGVLANLYFDVYVDDKEKAEGMLVDISNRIAGETGVVYAVGTIERAIETPDKKYSAAAEIKILTDSFRTLIKVCMLYGPMAIEIEKPDELHLSISDAQDILFDTAQMSHEFTTTMLYRMLKPEERIELKKKIDQRAELGKELLKKISGKKEKEGEDG